MILHRKVRGILNKLTPEKFHKLSNDILNVGLDSTTLLKGVILLIFEKALDEPKYCSMYAQLCKRLSEEAPNFDPPDGPCTFNRLLLSKCQDEFERRRRASEIWDGSEGSALSAEQEEERAAAKRKMVGNLRFIGELGKLEIIHESILHRCIQQLLEKRRSRPMVDLAEDLECLCQIMKTCGKVLDKPKAKNLMDQYFERMYQLSSNMELLSRVRFMLQDVLDLRAANWVPRKVAQVDGPRTIRQVREEAAHDLGVYIPPPSSHGPPRSSGPISPLAGVSSFFPQPGGNRTGMEDVFMGAVTLGTGPGVISSQPDKYGYDSNGFGGGVSGGGSYRPRQQQGGFIQHNSYQNKHFNNQNYNRQQQNNQYNQQQNYSNIANKDLPPRFKKMFSHSSGGGSSSSDGEVSLRPAASSMMLKPKTPGVLPQSALGQQGNDHHIHSSLPLAPQPQPPNQKPTPPLMHKDPPILIKQASMEKSKANRNKGPSREEWLRRVKNLSEQLMKEQSLDDTVESYRSLKLPERLTAEAAQVIINLLLTQEAESNRELGSQLLERLRSEGLMNVDRLFDGVKQVLGRLDDLVTDVPRVKSHMAGILGHLIASGTLPLADVAEPLEGGQHFPLFLLILQTLHKLLGKSNLTQTFNESKVNLLNLLPESDRTKEKLADLLEDRELSFLFPLLRIQSDLWRALIADPTPHAFYKYIKDTLDPEHHTAPGFINALMTVLVKYIVQETTLAAGADPTTIPEKMVTEREQELLAKFKPVLQAFLHDHLPLQVTAIYALQVFTYTNNFPKGMLLRWFVNLYDLEIVEEDAFLTWKEDLSQDYPGKGKALFQVNQWLTWLQETEEDDEEDEGDA
ncbi:eukaryotic translation initiation factor 4 gamma 2-like isoform X5 [Penaeus japonicus]|uniref:eukaryotic translation initiation factor 4 gamma 2-like isoform X5 n=1 Tax=Penaeus japonicus TaxID=27405 RepID=UPI001C70F21B|nr:eukaryotic translation initiation factor 4 gamma 2-like isoform X5 [Penaeus japonicus]XP_042864184.1 eukaryotic translation initiation factor 4 gamma 2-like isoform X5 [Penaeus japonicus]XP_042864185.1 eukaryotic translation initiation factor 4 gamma 2-like isoform X5 [Penaeus japonicus]